MAHQNRRHGEGRQPKVLGIGDSPAGERAAAGESGPLETMTMTECTVDTIVETVPAPAVAREETQELARKVRAMMPAVREELVNELKARVKSGTYDVSSQTIASDIMEHRLARIE